MQFLYLRFSIHATITFVVSVGWKKFLRSRFSDIINDLCLHKLNVLFNIISIHYADEYWIPNSICNMYIACIRLTLSQCRLFAS